MIYKKPSIVRSFCSCSRWSTWSNRIGVGIPGAKAALLLLSALSLSSHAQSLPGQITVTALPYVLTDQGGLVVVATTVPLKPVPQQVTNSGFASLLGGGFSAINSYLPGSTGGVAAAATIVAVRKITQLRIASAAAEKNINQTQQDANNAIAKAKDADDFSCSDVEPNMVGFNGTKTGPMPNLTNARVVSNRIRVVPNRIKALRMRHALPMLTAAAETCELPQEQQAEQAEAELDTLTESETASEDAIEAAEAAADAAEAAAEAAEVAAESALEAVEILDAILETCSLF